MKLNSKKRNAGVLLVGGIIATFCGWEYQEDYSEIVSMLVFWGGLLMIVASSYIYGGIISDLEKQITKQENQNDIE